MPLRCSLGAYASEIHVKFKRFKICSIKIQRLLPVNVDWLLLAKPIHSENGLNVVGRVPGRVEDDDSVGSHKVDPETSGFGRNQE